MTCIAAAIDKDGTVVMGADRVGVDNGRVRALASPKIIRSGSFLIGVCGTLRTVQIAHHIFKPPKPRGELFAFMVAKFATELRECMKEQGGETKDGEYTLMDGGLLVACRGRVFEVDSSYSVIEVAEPFHAIGCAMQEARSAMHARRKSSAAAMVKAGLEAAAAFDINIRPPFDFEAQGPPQRTIKRPPPMKTRIPLARIDAAIREVVNGRRKSAPPK